MPCGGTFVRGGLVLLIRAFVVGSFDVAKMIGIPMRDSPEVCRMAEMYHGGHLHFLVVLCANEE